MTRSTKRCAAAALSVLSLALFATACASAPAHPESSPGPSAHVSDTETGGIFRLSDDSKSVSLSIDAPPEKVWGALSVVYEKLGIRSELNDSTARSIGTRAYSQSRLDGKRTRDWVRCGNDGAGPSSGGMARTRISIVSTVRSAAEGRSDLVTEVGGSSTSVEGTSTGAVACASKGELEQRIRDLVLEELAR